MDKERETDQKQEPSNGLLVQDTQAKDYELPGALPDPTPARRNTYKVQMVEIEDKYWESDARMPKSKRFILEEIEDGREEENEFEDIVEPLPGTERAWEEEELPLAPPDNTTNRL
jgi:hypothetical protein